MRNLKKVLALALATVMLLGMMAMASAADFTDEALIADEYDCAVDVMQAIGVFNGSKGYLNPKNTLSRAEAAKVITYLAITKANADKLGTAAAPFADVPADNWAAGSIAYAKKLGIVSGSNGNYDPNGTLTGFQFAKMLLVVLGYNADFEGYKGEGWDSNVNLAALQAGLLKGLAIELGDAITREQAAQMAYNALQADCVYYTGNTSITIGDAQIAVGGTRLPYGQTLNEKLYPTLVKTEVAADDAFGYNVKTWTMGATEVATEKDYTVLATYAGTAGTLTKGAVYNIFGGTNNATYAVYVNGADTTTVQATKGSTTPAGLAEYAGATVEFVKNADGTKEVLITKAALTTVTTVTAATATADRTVTLANGKVLTTEAYAKDQYVLVYIGNDGEVAKHEAAPSVYGTMTQATKAADGEVTALYVDGVAVPVAGDNVDVDADDFAAALNKKYTVYTVNGYAMKVVADAAAKVSMSKLVYVYGGGLIAGEYTTSANTAEVKIVNMDGTKGTLKVDPATFAASGMFEQNALVDGFEGAGLYKITATNTTTGVNTLASMDAVEANNADKTVVAYFGGEKGAVSKASTDVAEAVASTKKAYYTANTQVLTISADAKTAALGAVPATAEFGANTWIIYTETATADVFEIEQIVTIGAATVTTTDLYYAVATEVGQVYVAAAAKTYKQYNVYEIATGAKKTVLVDETAAALTTGFKSLTKVDANGVYTFGAASGYGVEFALDQTNFSAYGNLITGAGLVDADATDAVIVNATTTADLTLAKIVKDAAKVDGVAIKSSTANKVIAIVVTAFSAT